MIFRAPSEAAGTGAVRVCVGGSVVGAEDGRVAVLGLWGVDVQAAHLPVRAVHHLHELTTPSGGSTPPSASGDRRSGKTVPTHFKTNKRLGSCSNRPG